MLASSRQKLKSIFRENYKNQHNQKYLYIALLLIIVYVCVHILLCTLDEVLVRGKRDENNAGKKKKKQCEPLAMMFQSQIEVKTVI